MSVNSKMTALADEIRELSGTSEAIGLDAMTNYVDEANTDVATEADLIALIVDALKEKSSNSIKLSSLSGNIILSPDIDLLDSDGFIEFINADGNNDGLYLFNYNPGDIITISVLKNSLLYVADRAYNREGIYCLNNGNSSEYISGGIYRIEDDNFSFTITN